jgi:hypothetical protein
MSEIVIHDFGVKIGGARKDIRGNVTRDDIAAMTPEERLKLVTKNVVWPTPDYVAMVKDQGYTQRAAAMVKMLRDSFPAGPSFSTTATEEQKAHGAQMYNALVGTAKAVASGGKTEIDLAVALRDSPEAKEYLCTVWGQTSQLQMRTSSQPTIGPARLFDSAVKAAFDGSYSAGSEIRHVLRYFACGSVDHSTQRMLNRNQEWPEGTSLSAGWLRKMDVSVAPHDGGWALARRGMTRFPGDSWQAKHLSDAGFKDLLGKAFPTEEEALAAVTAVADAHFAAKRESAKVKRDTLLGRALGKKPGATAPMLERVGKDRRDGADATGDDYLQEFALRGGEFGLWVNQDERQEVLNKGFDAFCDLADAFDLPPSAVSLGGQLAIAFGARGRGGWAAAHYEPGRRVINLTKPSGEGCLAHEWGHALDHHLGIRAAELGLVSSLVESGQAGYLSNVVLKAESGVTPPGGEEAYLREFHKTMASIWTNTEPRTKGEVLQQAEHRRSIALRNLMVTMSNVAATFKHAAGSNPARLEEFEKHMAVLRKPEEGKELESLNVALGSIVMMPEITSHPIRNHIDHYRLHAVRAISERDEKAALPDDWRGDASKRRTNYAQSCGALDAKKEKPYFSQPCEMFARTIEAVVADTLGERKNYNCFLVQGANGEAFPADFERTRLKDRIAPLLQEFKQFMPAQLLKAPEPEVAPTRPPLAEPRAAAISGQQLDLL